MKRLNNVIYMCVCVCMCVYVCVFMNVCPYICACLYICINVQYSVFRYYTEDYQSLNEVIQTRLNSLLPLLHQSIENI